MDIDALMRPLTGATAPCGLDMMFSTEFDMIQEARRHDDPSLAQGEWITDVKEADWPRVVQICETLLAGCTKDIRVAVWLTEAMCQTRGLEGLADGYILLNRLCGQWWPTLHPLPEDGDYGQRVGSLDWLVNRSARLIREFPLTQSSKGRYSLQDLESARATASSMERNPGMADDLARKAHLTMPQFEAARKDSPAQHFVSTLATVERARTAIGSFKAVIDAALADEAPAFGAVFDALEDLDGACRRYASDAGVWPGKTQKTDTQPAQENVMPAKDSAPQNAARLAGPVQSREDAIRQLNDIAAFFKRTEPHSPVAYLAEKAARWGNMSLHEWLRAVVKDDTALSQMEDLLGVVPTPHEASEPDC